LDTVCPHCFARVSNQARFCEFCGTAIHPEMSAGETSQLICPACGEGHTLTSRAYGNVSALECQRCAGLWLSNEAFKQLTDQAAKEGVQNDPRWTPALARAPQVDVPLPHDGVHYRPCVMCHQLMLKQNYSHSGVLVDVCGKHGVWLDADALPRIIDWIHAGGLVWMNNQAAQRQAAEQARQQSQAKAEAELIESNIQPARPSRNFDLGGSVVARIIRWVLGIFS
jgi:Zn-finger nucleic acid-binding protein